MGHTSSKSETKCACGEKATFRCETVIPYDCTDYPMYPIPDLFMANEKREALKILKQYWKRTIGTKVQFVVCDECLCDEARPYFTHKPKGWKEGPISGCYEQVKQICEFTNVDL